MSLEVEFLQVKMAADIAAFREDMGKAVRVAEKSAKQIERALGTVQSAFAALGGALVFKQIVSEAAEAEQAMAQVRATIASTGGAAGVTAQQVADLASRLSELSGIDDDVILKSQSILLTFTRISSDIFPAASQAVLDLSVKLGTDLNAAAIQVGKALQDPERGITALRRAGVSFTKEQEAVIDSLVKTGQLAKAQTMILQELQREFGGSAQAARNTLGGALKALETNFNELLESIGSSQSDGIRGAIEALNSLLRGLADNAQTVSNLLLAAATLGGFAVLPKVLGAIRTAALAASRALFVTFANPWTALAATIGIATGAMIAFKDATIQTANGAIKLGDMVRIAWEDIGRTIKDVVEQVSNAVPFLLEGPSGIAALIGASPQLSALSQVQAMRRKQLRDRAIKASIAGPQERVNIGTISEQQDTQEHINTEAARDLKARQQIAAETVRALREQNDHLEAQLRGEAALIPFQRARERIERNITGLKQKQTLILQVNEQQQRFLALQGLELVHALEEQNEQLAAQVRGEAALVPFQRARQYIERNITDQKQRQQLLARVDQEQRRFLNLQAENKLESVRREVALENELIGLNEQEASLQREIVELRERMAGASTADLAAAEERLRLLRETQALNREREEFLTSGFIDRAETREPRTVVEAITRSADSAETIRDSFDAAETSVQRTVSEFLSAEQQAITAADEARRLNEAAVKQRQRTESFSFQGSDALIQGSTARFEVPGQQQPQGVRNVVEFFAQSQLRRNILDAIASVQRMEPFRQLGGFFEELGKQAIAFATRTASTDSIIEQIRGRVQQLAKSGFGMDVITDALTQAFTAVQQALARPIELRQRVSTGLQTVNDPLSQALAQLSQPRPAPVVTTFTKVHTVSPAELGIPQLAHGGPLSAGDIALVGERGPELFVPGRSGQVVPMAQASGGRYGNIYITNYAGERVDTRERAGSVAGVKDLEIIIGRAIANDAISGGPGIRAIERALGVRRNPSLA